MLRRLATVSACAIALALASPATAHADSRTLADSRGDVWEMDTPEPGQNTRVPDRRQGDIVRTVLAHNHSRVVIRTRFAQLDRVGRRSVMVARLRTNTGMVRWVVLEAGPRPRTHRWRGTTYVTRRDGETRVECAVTHRLDYAADVALLRIPRSCLGDPRWVQGSFAVATFAPRDTHVYTDNPQNDGPTVNLPRYTPHIRRG